MVITGTTSAATDGSARDDFRWPIRVYYEDTDAAGVVYYANYLKFMERARTEWLRGLGHEQDALREHHGVLFTVARLSVEYLRSARFNDLLDVGVRILRRGHASLDLAQGVYRGGDELLCRGEVRIACIGADDLRPCAMPIALFSREPVPGARR